MDKDKNLEKSLGSVDAGPGERVRHAVMNEYAAEFQNQRGKKFWYRAVPMYKAVAAAILIALASALTGAWFASSTQESQSTPTYAESDKAMAATRFEPVIAESDAF